MCMNNTVPPPHHHPYTRINTVVGILPLFIIITHNAKDFIFFF